MEVLGSPLTNNYSKGMPINWFYEGNEFIDEIENLCRSLALQAFHLDATKWGINVQPYSGSSANFTAYMIVLQPMIVSWGWIFPPKFSSDTAPLEERRSWQPRSTSRFFLTMRFGCICGGSAYQWDYARFRAIADMCGTLLLCDMAHINNKIEKVCELCNITLNKNAVFGDSSVLAPGGVRIGTPAMNSRGLVGKDFEQIGEFLHRAVTITLSVQKEHGKLFKDFLVNNKEVEELKAAVKNK
ncbi:hypothetical protein UlMin_010507 [Ulmus minor]